MLEPEHMKYRNLYKNLNRISFLETSGKNLFVLLLFFNLIGYQQLFSQNIKDVSAGVIDILINVPKINGVVKPGGEAALRVVRDLLIQSSLRDHQLGVASAGKTELELQEANGVQAQLVRDADGKVYLVQNGQIFPINQNVVDQARLLNVSNGISSKSEIPSFDIRILSNAFYFTQDTSYVVYKFSKEKTYITDILNEEHCTREDIAIHLYGFLHGFDTHEQQVANAPYKNNTYSLDNLFLIHPMFRNSGYFDGRKPIKTRKGYPEIIDYAGFNNAFTAAVYIRKLTVPTKINASFTCKWAKDIDDDGFYIEDFHGISRVFTEGDEFVIVAVCQGNVASQLSFEIYDELTGIKCYSDVTTLSNSGKIVKFNIPKNYFIPGRYFYNFHHKNSVGVNTSTKESFIIEPTENLLSTKTQSIADVGDNKNIEVDNLNDILYELISKKTITQSDYISINLAISGDKDAKASASEILFNLVSSGKIDAITFKSISDAINK